MLAPGPSLSSGRHPLPPRPPRGPFPPAFFLLPAHSPSVKPCPGADLSQGTASLREPFLSEKPHRGMLLMLAGPAVNGVPPRLPVPSACRLGREFCLLSAGRTRVRPDVSSSAPVSRAPGPRPPRDPRGGAPLLPASRRSAGLLRKGTGLLGRKGDIRWMGRRRSGLGQRTEYRWAFPGQPGDLSLSPGPLVADHTGCQPCHNRTEWGRVGANGGGRCLIELLLGLELMNHNCKKS